MKNPNSNSPENPTPQAFNAFREVRLFIAGTFGRLGQKMGFTNKTPGQDSLRIGGRFASISMALVLLILAGFSIGTVIASKIAANKSDHATQLSNLYQEARYDVGAEESLERKYRLEPGPDVLAKYQTAADALVEKLKAVKSLEPSEGKNVDPVLILHESYLKSIGRMFAAVDAKDTQQVLAIDAGEVDPSFSEIDQRVNTAADQRQQEAKQYLADFARTQNLVLTTTPIVFIMGLILLYVFWSVIPAYQTRIDQARQLASQTEHDSQQRLINTLEQRVADRTKALTTSAEVSRRLSQASNPQQLAVELVEQVQVAFHYYHAQIYFRDDATGDLVMSAGTGEAGAAMLERGHKVPKGRGLVGRAAETNIPILVKDVSQAEGWLPNPLLPETKSEVAIPISQGEQVLGVLDVQQNRVNGLGEEDVSLLQSLAGQVSISLQNARRFEESRVKAELESTVNAIGQKIQRATSMEDALQTAIREIGVALGASRVSAIIGTSHLGDGNG